MSDKRFRKFLIDKDATKMFMKYGVMKKFCRCYGGVFGDKVVISRLVGKNSVFRKTEIWNEIRNRYVSDDIPKEILRWFE